MLTIFTIAPNTYDCPHHSDYKSNVWLLYPNVWLLYSNIPFLCVTNLPWVSLVFRLIIVLGEQIPVFSIISLVNNDF